MSMGSNKIIMDTFGDSGRFRTAFCFRDKVYLVNNVGQVTGFSSPTIRKIRDSYFVNYEIGITICLNCTPTIDEVVKNIKDDEFLSVNQGIPQENFREAFIRDGSTSEWLLDRICGDMDACTLSAKSAVDAIKSDASEIFLKMQRLYTTAFNDIIMDRLLKML